MTNSNVIEIIIPEYEGKIVLVKKRRAKYKRVKTTDEKGKSVITKVLANPKAVGTPKYWNVNGQDIYNGNLPPMARAAMMGKLKAYLASFIPKSLKIPNDWLGSLKISLEIHDLMPSSRYWDCDNKWPWLKAFSDCLTDGGHIPDDNILYVKSNGEIVFVPAADEKSRKLVFKLEKL